jgi:hypothetical protein
MRVVLILSIIYFSLFQKKTHAQVNFEWVNQNIGGLLLAIDSNNNIYTARGFISPFLIGDTLLEPKGTQDFYVTKIDEYGNYIWVIQFGGNNKTSVNDFVADKDKSIYITGSFRNTTDFNPSPLIEYNLVSKGIFHDSYICKLDEDGNFIWAKQFESSYDVDSKFICVNDKSNVIYVAGFYSGTVDFNPSETESHHLTSSYNNDLFLCKLDSLGNFLWVRNIFSKQNKFFTDITSDSFDNIYVTGMFRDTLYFEYNGLIDTLIPENSLWNVFLAKYDKEGNFIWHQKYNSDETIWSKKVIAFNQDKICLLGTFYGTVEIGDNEYISNYFGSSTFLLTLNNNGEYISCKLLSATTNSSAVTGESIYINKNNEFYISGYFTDTNDFDPSISEYILTSEGKTNAFVCKLDNQENFLWAKQFGTKVNEIHYSSISTVQSMIVSNNLEIYTTGQFYNFPQDFNPSPNDEYILDPSDGGTFIHKMKEWSVSIESPTNNFHNDILVYPNPNSGVFNIETNNETFITIKNILGQLVYQQTIYNNTQIDLSKNNKGIYILDARQEEKFFRTKLILE